MRHIAVIGGGISGLAAAYYLQKKTTEPISVTLLESGPYWGGKIVTHRSDGFVIEGGPDTFVVTKPWGIKLCKELGIYDRLKGTNPNSRKTYILKHDQLHELPGGLTMMIPTEFAPMLRTGLLSWPAKVRMGFDFFLPPAPDNGDESLGEFVTRRLGRSAYENLIEPLMSGIYAGDGDRLSLQSTFPFLRDLRKPLDFKIKVPKHDDRKTEDITHDQLQKLLEVLNEEDNILVANIMRLGLFTGMRKSETLRLQWDNIDFERGFISIRESTGGKSEKIPLNSSARALLENHPRHKSSPFIFPGVKGEIRHRNSFARQLRRIKKRAGLPDNFRPLHGLRHVYASMLASSGKVDMYTLQKLLTHKSPQMTQRYAHLRDETLKKASNLAGEIIDEIAKEK